jgi:pimeloyl-ACP methyl ester carboxylesterase
MNHFETGLYGSVPYVRTGMGQQPIVVLSGGNAFVGRFDEQRAARDARRIAKLFPRDSGLCILYYDLSCSDMEAVVTQLAVIIRTQFGAAMLAGISFGGLLALRLAGDAPDVVRELILIASAHRFSPDGRERIERQIADLSRGDFAAMARPFALLFRRRWLTLISRFALWRRRHTLHERMNDPAAIIRMLEAALRASGTDAGTLGRIGCRALIVGGTRDQFFDRGALEETAAAIASAELVLVNGETHMLPIERPHAVAQAIRSFLSTPSHRSQSLPRAR